MSLWAHLSILDPAPPWPLSTALFFVGAYAVLWIAALSFVSVNTGEITGSAPSARTLAFCAFLSGLVTVVGLVSWARRSLWARQLSADSTWADGLRLRYPTQQNTLLVIALLAFGLAFAIDVLGGLLNLKGGQIVPPILQALCRLGPVPTGGPVCSQPNQDALTWLLAVVVASGIQPVAEGLVFAGLLYPALVRFFMDSRIAVIGVALVYMLVSLLLSAAPGVWYALIQPLLMIIVVAGIRNYYKSTRAAILARAAFGVFFVLTALFSLRLGGGV